MSSLIHPDMRRRLNRGIEEARHPVGASVHDGTFRVLAHDVARLLLVIDKLEGDATKLTALYAVRMDQLNEALDTCDWLRGRRS